MKDSYLILLIVLLLFFSCTNTRRDSTGKIGVKGTATPIGQSSKSGNQPAYQTGSANKTVSNSFLSNDAAFISQHLLQGRFEVELNKYDTFTKKYCLPEQLSKQTAIKEFEGFRNVGDIDKDGRDDYVFVLSPINRCEEGQSYYFSNPTIPRIYTDSECCHPESIFPIEDIDEDGSNEIAQYYSSCASRYKAITVWTLKNNIWKEIESFSYIINDEYKVFEDFNKLSKKVGKNTFRFLEISDLTAGGKLVKQWKTITMK